METAEGIEEFVVLGDTVVTLVEKSDDQLDDEVLLTTNSSD